MGFFADVGRANIPQRIGAAIQNVAAIEDIRMARMKQEQMRYEMEPIDVTNSQFAQGLAEAGDHLSAAWPKYVKMMGYDPTNIPRKAANDLRISFFTKDWDKIGKIQSELDQRNMKAKLQQLIEKRAAFNALDNPTLKEQQGNDRNELEIQRISSKLAVHTGRINQIPQMQSQIQAEQDALLQRKQAESAIIEDRQRRTAEYRSGLTEARQRRMTDYKAGLPAKERTATTARESLKLRIQKNWESKYGPPSGLLGRVEIKRPEERRKLLRGWLKERAIEEKKGQPIFTSDELDQSEQRIMSTLGISLELQDGLKAARLAGASLDELIELINTFVTPTAK